MLLYFDNYFKMQLNLVKYRGKGHIIYKIMSTFAVWYLTTKPQIAQIMLIISLVMSN